MTSLRHLRPTEAQLWSRIRKHLEHGNDRAYRIESSITPGFPDVVWYPDMRGPVFIELKAGVLTFRASQRKFAKDLTMIGQTVWLIWQAYKRETPVVWRADWMMNPPMPDDARGEHLEDWIKRMRQ